MKIVDTLALPAGKTDTIYFDDTFPGFGIRLWAGGRKAFVFQFQIGQKQRRMTLGSAGVLKLAEARKIASQHHADVRRGEDPAAAKQEKVRQAAETFEAVLGTYLPHKKAALRAASYVALERALLRYAKPLHGLGVAGVSRRDVGSLLDAVAASSGNATANRVRASLSAFFAWGMARGLVEANPVIGTEVASEPARVLSMAELAAVWKACGDNAYGSIVRLLILTGQRREEIGGLRHGEVRDDMLVLPGERTKNKHAHVIPLSSLARGILSAHRGTGPFVFGAGKPFATWSYGKVSLDKALAAASVEMTAWVLHDLRRSAATHMAEIGIQPHIVEAVLNHTGGHKAGVAGIYNRASYEKEKRQALELWAAHVLAAVEGRAVNVVPLRA